MTQARWGAGRKLLLVAVLLAGVLRVGNLARLVAGHPDIVWQDPASVRQRYASTTDPTPNLGFESSATAYAWVCGGQGLASPFGGRSGPSAWAPPGSVTLYALAFRLFGCFTPGSILFLGGVSVLLSMALVVVCFHAALELFASERVAALAAFLAAVSPFDLMSQGTMDLNTLELLFALTLLAQLRYWNRGDTGAALWVAIASGVAALFNPIFAVSAALSLLLRWRRQAWSVSVAHLVLLLLVQAAVVGPYVLYQRSRLHAWVPVKSNAPFELWLGNLPDVAGVLTTEAFVAHHPSRNRDEYRRYCALGEVAYVDEKREQLLAQLDWERFARTTARRFVFLFFRVHPTAAGGGVVGLLEAGLWLAFGLVLALGPLLVRRLADGALPVAYLHLGCYALPFLLTGVMDRYRLPVTPLALLLAAALLAGRGSDTPTATR